MEAKIITIVGGGSTYTPGVVKAILSKKDTFAVKEIRAYDIDEQHQEDVAIIVREVVKATCPECKLLRLQIQRKHLLIQILSLHKFV